MSKVISDRELMCSVRDRTDMRAFEALVERWEGRLGILLVRLTGNMQCACDLRQETFLRVWKSAGNYKDTYAFSTWVTRIAINLARSNAAKKSRRSENGDGITQSPTHIDWVDSVATLEAGDQAASLQPVLNRLAAPEKELLLLRFQLELTYPEIAETLGIPETTVKSRMTVLLRRLRDSLTRSGFQRSDLIL
ncbi:MAG: RNA polymerase sigma factor [Candidatus Hydrogenedentes bacterium]|nr:RNA polymerase sigma factor [Candidatus Hydrogenedentota bacterium]